MRRTFLALAVLAAALVTPPVAAAPAGPVAPAGPGAPQPRGLVVTHARTVHLITGDTVRVLTRSDGTTVPRIVAGPHAGGPVARWSSYLVPRLPAALRSRLDTSLFDVSRLSAGRVPVLVALRDDVAPRARRAAGDALHLGRTSSGAVRGWYGARGLDAHDLAAVREVRLPGAPSTAVPDGPTHRLTVQVDSGAGNPVAYATVLVLDVDDSEQFLETADTHRNGRVTVDVPEGDYAVMAWTFSKLLVAPETAVSADSVVSLNLADATVRPQVSLPGYRKTDTVLSVGRSADTGFSFPLQFSGPRFFMQVQPASADVEHGALTTGVSAKLVPTDSGPARTAKQIAVTGDVVPGVPDDLTFDHEEGDFARVVQRFYGNGPAGRRQTWVDASGPNVEFFTGQEFDTRVPGRRVLLLQASPDLYYQQTALPQAPPGSDNLTQLLALGRYPRPGRTHRVTFAHGPVGPGVEGRSLFGGVHRRGDELFGYLPLFSGAGSGMISYVAAKRDGDWSLRQGGREIARGAREISFDAKVPRGRRTYELTASSHPSAANWTLSTDVEDTWTFHSARGTARPPLLTPSYVPPSSMSGYVEPGRTGFDLSFGTPSRDPRIARATVEISTDGTHWRPVRADRTAPDAFRVRYRNPAGPGTVSIRVTGRDRHGNAVRETAMDVYRLR